MKALRWMVMAALMLAAAQASAACNWPAWERFKQDYISDGGRVIDPSDARQITTSEGQSYALFFALAANDRDAFKTVLSWTQNNTAEGDLSARLPAWLWGRKNETEWTVLDTNSASDADIWITGLCWKPDGCGTCRTIPGSEKRCSHALPKKR